MVAEIEFSVKFWVGIGRCSDRENFLNQKIKSAWKNRSEARIFRRKLYGEFGSWKGGTLGDEKSKIFDFSGGV